MKYFDVEQGSDEWLELRLGKATASRFADILATIGKGEAAARRNYRAALVVERLMGTIGDRYANQFMDYGHETEPLARLTYSLKTGLEVKEAGFFQHDELEAGASPDGLVVGHPGGIEIKCRQIGNHILALKNDEMPLEYMAQVQGNMWLTECEWWDFVSFAPELPENAQIFIQRIYRDDSYITRLKNQVKLFLDEVDQEEHDIKQYKFRHKIIKKMEQVA